MTHWCSIVSTLFTWQRHTFCPSTATTRLSGFNCFLTTKLLWPLTFEECATGKDQRGSIGSSNEYWTHAHWWRNTDVTSRCLLIIFITFLQLCFLELQQLRVCLDCCRLLLNQPTSNCACSNLSFSTTGQYKYWTSGRHEFPSDSMNFQWNKKMFTAVNTNDSNWLTYILWYQVIGKNDVFRKNPTIHSGRRV